MKQFREYVKKMAHYEEAIGVLHWDLRTGAPRKGMASRSEVIGTLSTELFKMTTSSEMAQFIDTYTDDEEFAKLDLVSQRIIKRCQKEYERSHNIPADL